MGGRQFSAPQVFVRSCCFPPEEVTILVCTLLQSLQIMIELLLFLQKYSILVVVPKTSDILNLLVKSLSPVCALSPYFSELSFKLAHSLGVNVDLSHVYRPTL
jgi:hypothetical protein